MKRNLFLVGLAALTLLYTACKKDSDSTGGVLFSAERLQGFWVPYELIENGVVYAGPFSGNGLFGAYAESVVINNDHSFIPVSYFQGNKLLKTDEKGTYRLNPLSGKMLMEGIFTIDA